MKKILLMIGLLFLPFSVNALVDGDISLTCEKNVLLPGESTTCSIDAVVTNGEVSSFIGKINVGDGLSFVRLTESDFKIEDDFYDYSDLSLVVSGDNNLTGNFNVVKFIVSAGDVSGVDVNVSITDAELGIFDSEDENTIGMPVSIDPYTIHIPSGDNSLSEIKVNGSVIEGFTSSTTDYVLEVPSDLSEVVISAIATDGSSTVTGDVETKQIGYGENNFSINVKAENGSERVYNVKIIRPEIRELTSLKINDENIDLVSGTYRYIYKVENEVTSVNIVASAGEDISFSEGFGSRTEKDLKVGNNEFLVKTVDSNGDELVYTIVIDRFNEKGKDVAPKEPKEEKKPSGTVENPKTGITGASIVLVGGCIVLYMVARKKGFIKKI